MTDQEPEIPENFPPVTEKKRRFSGIWILPIIAALIVGFLAARSYMEHGPDITITFKSATGLSVGQTQIKYKAVTLGTINSIELEKDLSGVIAHAAMNASARPFLTESAKFWVVRPQLTAGNISDIQLLVSGTYIQLEPGAPDDEKQTDFEGLEQPLDGRSDEPGRVYMLKAEKLGSVGLGSPVYFRDINVGQVLSYDIGNGFGPVSINIFVRDPYAQYVRPDSRFWNASGLNVKLEGGLHLEFQSLQTIVAGGISFSTPQDAVSQPQAAAKSTFTLYGSRQIAEMANGKHYPCVSYFQSPIKDLALGSPVQIYGVNVGEVTEVKLVFDPQQNQSRIRVTFDIKPDLAFGPAAGDAKNVTRIMNSLLEKGMRAALGSSELVAGNDVITLGFAPKSELTEVAMEGDALVVPGASGGNIADVMKDLSDKLGQIPFDQIGQHLNHLLASADETLGGDEMKQAMHDLADTLANVKKISQSADENLTPALNKLPDISSKLQSTIAHADEFMSSVDNGYGGNSDFHRNMERVMDEVNDAARSIRLLADYLDRHPEALISGKRTSDETIKKDKP